MAAPVTSITVGPVNARTDPETGLRFYVWQGVEYPSVTSLRRMAGLPFNLHQWTLSRVIERAVTEFSVMETMMKRPARARERVRDKNVVKEVSRWLRSAATEERDAAAELGTAVHDAATKRQPVATASPDVAPFLAQFYDWLDVSKATILTVERQIWNTTVGYAGTFDLLVQLPSGEVIVVDIKTGRGIYPEHALQIIAYSLAEFVGENDVVDPVMTGHLLGASGMALLHLSEANWTWARVQPNPSMYEAFRGLLAFGRWMFANQDLAPLLSVERSGSAMLPKAP
jgi:hypothetical protein